jgi:two-component system sensor histidine kinase DegS
MVALCAIAGQIAVHVVMKIHSYDSAKINFGGRQRMLSQRIAFEIVSLVYYKQDGINVNSTAAATQLTALAKELNVSTTLWASSQTGLVAGSDSLGTIQETDSTILGLYDSLNTNYFYPYYWLIGNFTTANWSDPTYTSPTIDSCVSLRQNFLVGMNNIVTTYQSQSDIRLNNLVIIEGVFLGVTLAILIFELVFVARPAIQHMNNLDKITKENQAKEPLGKIAEA